VAQDAAWRGRYAPPRRGSQKPMSVTGALSTVDDSTGSEIHPTLEQPAVSRTARRALHLFQADDHQLLQTVNRGEFLTGIQKPDLQLILYGPVHPNSPLSLKEKRRVHGDQPQAENPPSARTDPEGPQNLSLPVTSHGRLAITAVLTMDRTSIACHRGCLENRRGARRIDG